MKAFYQTDAGKVRSHNEDSVTIIKNLNDEYLAVVADGMGGHKAGEVASSLVVGELGKRFSELSSIGSKEEAVIWLKEIIDEINVKILRYAEEHVDANGLGTTCVCAILTKDFLIFLENGELTESAAMTHPQKNVLMRALGAAETIEMDIFDVERDVDGVFLCSDGLTNMLTVEQMEKVLNDKDLDLQDQVGKMIMKANMRGGTDNITIACIRFGGE